MANYDIGSLLLELGFEGEREFNSTLSGLERSIASADKAGVAFYNHNRTGYNELKTLVASSAAQLGTLEGRYQAGELSAREYARALEAIRSVQQVAAAGGAKLASSLSSVDARYKELRSTATTTEAALQKYEQRLTIIDNLHRAGVTNTRQFRRELDELRDDAMGAAQGLNELSQEYTEYVSVAGRAGAIKSRVDQAGLRDSYFSRQFILGNALSNMYGELGIRAFDLAANTIRSFDDMSVAWERSVDQADELIDTSLRMGASFAEVQAHVDAVSQKYFVLATDAEGAAAALLDAGLETEQVRDLLDAVGASALKNGGSVREAFAQIASSGGDIEGALTAATGSTEAYDRALLSAASGQRDMVASLTQGERQAALVAAVMQGAGDALDGYKTRTDGIVGAQLAQSEVVQKFRREMGEELAPTVLKTTELMTAFVTAMTGAIAPIVNTAEAVGMLAGRFSLAETALLGLIILGPRFGGMLKGIASGALAVGGALRAVVGILGGWPAVIAIAAVSAVSLFSGPKKEAESFVSVMEGVSKKSREMATGFDTLKNATGQAGLENAVSLLASTMDGEMKTSFETFAANAIATAESTEEAIDRIMGRTAEAQAQMLEDEAANIRLQMAPLQDGQNAYAAQAGPTGKSAQVIRLEAELAQARAELAEATAEGDGQAILDMGEVIKSIQLELAEAMTDSMSGRAEELGRQLDPFERELKAIEQRIAALRGPNSKQALENELGRNPKLDEDEPPAPPTDPFVDLRANVGVARAELNLLRGEHQRLGSDDSYVQLATGLANYLGRVGELRAQMQSVQAAGNLSKTNQQEMINLLAEEAALRAEIGNSDNIERERKAASWVAGLEQKFGQGDMEASEGMRRLSESAKQLKSQMELFPQWSVMTPEQRNQFGMFERLLEMVGAGMETFQAALDEEKGAALFASAKKSIIDLVKAGERIPDDLLEQFAAGGGDTAVYDDYNAGLQEAAQKAADLLEIQLELEESVARMAVEQRLAGQPVDVLGNKRQGAQNAADSARELGTPEGDANALAWQAEADALTLVITKRDAMGEVTKGVIAQVGFLTDALADADRAEQRSADEGGTGLEQQAARVESLRGSLDSAVDSWGETSTAARQLTRELGPLSDALKKNQAFWEGQGEANPDAVLAELASQQYGSFAEAVEALGLAADDTSPLMEALKAAFNMDEIQPQIDRLKEMQEAVETIRVAMAAGLPAPKWATDVLAQGGAPLQEGPAGSSTNNAALRDANALIADYNAGLAAGPSLVSDLRQAESALMAEIDKTNGSTKEGAKALRDMAVALKQLQALMGEGSKLDFMQGANEQGLVSDNDFSAFATEQIEKHRAAQALLFEDAMAGNQAAIEAWNGHQAAINLYTAATEEAKTTTTALSSGFANLSASLTAAGMPEAAAGADVLAGTFAGLDKLLKGGSVEDGVRAIGEAFQQSADVAVAALGKMISGVTDLAVGIASGDPGAIVGGVLGLLAGLIDLFTMGAKELAEAQEEVRNYEKGFQIIDPTGAMSARAPTLDEQRETYDNERAQAAADGILWPWEDYDAWKQAIMPIKVDDAQLKASFEAAESGLSGAISGALKSFMATGNLGDFEAAFKDAVFNGLVEGFIASEAFKKTLGEPLNNFYTVSADPTSTQAEIDAAWAAVEAGYASAEQQMIAFGERWAGTFGADMITGELKGMFASAAQAGLDARLNMNVGIGDTSGVEAFKEAFSTSLKDMVKERLIEAFLESAAMKPLFDKLGAYLGEAMADGVITASESAMIDSLTQDITDATVPLYDALEELEGPKRVQLIIEKGDLGDLQKEYARLSDPKTEQNDRTRIQGQIVMNNLKKAELILHKEQLKLQRAQLLAKGNLTAGERTFLQFTARSLAATNEQIVGLNQQNKSLEEQLANWDKLNAKQREQLKGKIKVELGIDVDSLQGSLASAFDASSYEEFVSGFGNSMRDTMRNALVTAFLETAAMQAVLKKLSDAIFAAMADGQVTEGEMKGIRELSKAAEKLGGEFYKILEELNLTTPKDKGRGEKPDMSKWSLDKLYGERAEAARNGNKKRREEIEVEIKTRLQIGVEDLRSQLRSAFDSSTFGEFQKKWGEGLREITRNALITAFLEGAVMGPLLKRLSDQLMMAMADQKLSPEEKAQIEQTRGEISEEAKVFFEMLQAIGLGFKAPKKERDYSKDNIEQLYKMEGRGNKKARAEIDARLKIDVGTVRGALEKAFDSANLKSFHKNFGEAMREITRDAMIAAFLEGSVMQALFTAFSTTIRAALADGAISSGEMKEIRADQAAIAAEAAPFFQLLKSLGLGFKAPKQEPNYGEMGMEELWRRRGRAKGKRKEEIEVEIKGRLSVNKDDLAGEFREALETGSNKFSTNWRRSLRSTTRDALIAAFMEAAGMQRLYDKLGDSIAQAVRDKRITGDEKDRIGQIGKEIEAEGKLLEILLKQAGLGYKSYDGYDFEKMDFAKLYRGFDKAVRKGWKPDALQFEAEIKARLKISREDFGSSLQEALDSDTIGDFGTKLEVGVQQSVRDGLIAAFLESAAMKPLLEKLSDGAMEALRDGNVSQGELDRLLAIGGQIKGVGSDFFKLLDDLGLGFKDLNDKLATTTEQMTNVPSGFKLALARFNATEGVSRPGGDFRTQDQVARGNDFRGAQLTVVMPEGSNLDNIIDELDRRGAMKSGSNFGTPIVRSF